MTPEPCAFEGCGRSAHPRSAWCIGHLKQRQKGREMTALRPYGRDPWQTLKDVACRAIDLRDDVPQDWESWEAYLKTAAKRWAESHRPRGRPRRK